MFPICSTLVNYFGCFRPQICILHVETSPETIPYIWKPEICLKSYKHKEIIWFYTHWHINNFRVFGGSFREVFGTFVTCFSDSFLSMCRSNCRSTIAKNQKLSCTCPIRFLAGALIKAMQLTMTFFTRTLWNQLFLLSEWASHN